MWRRSNFPRTNAHVSALGMATFYNALAQEKLLTREHMERCRVSQGGLEADVVLGAPRSRSRLGPGLHAQSGRRGRSEQADLRPRRLRRFYGFVDLEHRIGYSYVMNNFDATKANADPRSVVLSDEVYSALGVTRD